MPAGIFGDTKILIVMLKDGGEDSHARFLPRDAGLLNQMAVHRPNAGSGIGFTPAEVASYTGGHLDADWCLHPNLNLLRDHLWETGDMAITHLVGGMVTDLAPLTTEQVRAATYNPNNTGIVLPISLGAHDTQQYGMSSMVFRDFNDGVRDWKISDSGFLGRLATRFAAFTEDQGSGALRPPTLPLGYCAGHRGTARNLINLDGITRPLDIPVANFGKFTTTYTTSAQQTAAITRLGNIMALSVDEPRQAAFRNIHNTAVTAAGFFSPVIERTYNGGSPVFAVDVHLGNSFGNWRHVMRTFARMIENMANGTTGLPKRLVLVGNLGSYDTHFAQGKLTGNLATFFTEEAAAVKGFRDAMIALGGGLWDRTIITDWSEFSRTLLQNGADGTDHSYARSCSIFGGAVRGKGVGGSTGHFGQWPTSYGIVGYNPNDFTGGGSDDIRGDQLGGGSLRPRISAEQYWDPILRWFGADNDDIAATLLRRSAFAGASPQLLL